jgi:hypothetical protein
MDAAGSGVSVALANTDRAKGFRVDTPPFAGHRLRDKRTEGTQAMVTVDTVGREADDACVHDEPCFNSTPRF